MIASNRPAPAEFKGHLHPDFANEMAREMAHFIKAAIESAATTLPELGLRMFHQWSIQELQRLVLTDEPNFEELCEFLARRWEIISSFPELSYNVSPENKVNQACLVLAGYLEKITEGKVSRYQLLMPTLTVTTNEASSTDLTENVLELQQFILSDDGSRFIEILPCLKFAEKDGIFKHTSLFDGQPSELSEQEIKKLTQHSKEALEYWQAIRKRKEAEEKSESFGAHLTRLIDKLREGGAHNAAYVEEKSQAGSELNSGGAANVAIAVFSEFLTTLDRDERNALMQLTAPGLTVSVENGNREPTFADIWAILARAKHEKYQKVIFCVELNANDIDRIYKNNKTWLDKTFPRNAKKANQYNMGMLEQDILDKKIALEKIMVDGENYIFYKELKKKAIRDDRLFLEKLFDITHLNIDAIKRLLLSCLDATPNDKSVLLTKIKNIPELYRELISTQEFKKILFDQAIAENNLDNIKQFVIQGVDINPILRSLIKKDPHKGITWLNHEPEICERINEAGMQSIMDILVESDEGCNFLWKNENHRRWCEDYILKMFETAKDPHLKKKMLSYVNRMIFSALSLNDMKDAKLLCDKFSSNLSDDVLMFLAQKNENEIIIDSLEKRKEVDNKLPCRLWESAIKTGNFLLAQLLVERGLVRDPLISFGSLDKNLEDTVFQNLKRYVFMMKGVDEFSPDYLYQLLGFNLFPKRIFDSDCVKYGITNRVFQNKSNCFDILDHAISGKLLLDEKNRERLDIIYWHIIKYADEFTTSDKEKFFLIFFHMMLRKNYRKYVGTMNPLFLLQSEDSLKKYSEPFSNLLLKEKSLNLWSLCCDAALLSSKYDGKLYWELEHYYGNITFHIFCSYLLSLFPSQDVFDKLAHSFFTSTHGGEIATKDLNKFSELAKKYQFKLSDKDFFLALDNNRVLPSMFPLLEEKTYEDENVFLKILCAASPNRWWSGKSRNNPGSELEYEKFLKFLPAWLKSHSVTPKTVEKLFAEADKQNLREVFSSLAEMATPEHCDWIVRAAEKGYWDSVSIYLNKHPVDDENFIKKLLSEADAQNLPLEFLNILKNANAPRNIIEQCHTLFTKNFFDRTRYILDSPPWCEKLSYNFLEDQLLLCITKDYLSREDIVKFANNHLDRLKNPTDMVRFMDKLFDTDRASDQKLTAPRSGLLQDFKNGHFFQRVRDNHRWKGEQVSEEWSVLVDTCRQKINAWKDQHQELELDDESFEFMKRPDSNTSAVLNYFRLT